MDSFTPTSNISSFPNGLFDPIDVDETITSPIAPEYENPILVPEDAPTKKSKNSRSNIVWDHFTKTFLVVDLQQPVVRCHHCKRPVGFHPNNRGTSSFRSHLIRCLLYKGKQTLLDTTQSRLTFDASKATGNESGALKVENYNKKDVRRRIA